MVSRGHGGGDVYAARGGTALNIADQHLHPRNLATALILCRLANSGGQALAGVPLLIGSFLLHPIMAALACRLRVLALALLEPAPFRLRLHRGRWLRCSAGMDFRSGQSSWREALASRTYYSIYRWSWYEWLGALAPLFLFWLLWRVAEKRGCVAHDPVRSSSAVSRLRCLLMAFSAGRGHGSARSESLVRLTPLQPMRYLQLVYLFMALAAGGCWAVRAETKIWRWANLLACLQRQHVPGRVGTDRRRSSP